MWWLYALLSALFAALTAVLAKVGIRGVDSNLATAIRTVVILVLTWAIVYARGGLSGLSTLTRTNLLFLGLSGVATGLSWLCYFRALQVGTVSQVAPVDKLSVALAIGLSVVFLGEKLTWQTSVGSGLIVVGTLVLLWK
ncbi:EamA family transporter [Hymenobacter guriensis]|uniref:EamA family transporter n=1 Tax=Hymenobacter guriensis TaxID=2793065 RepID=A0ABS0L9A0_9BACT|nr:EamA family transporter [Hymenobacter guriensis]MBG8556037.1 EamA family transporter [Hymenobacter guriensis]